MTTDRSLWLLVHSSTDAAPLCHCGQELDCCSTEHCPRCGSNLPLWAA